MTDQSYLKVYNHLQMPTEGHTITQHQMSSGTNSGTVYIMNKNRSWTPVSASGIAPMPTINPKSGFFQTMTSPDPPSAMAAITKQSTPTTIIRTSNKSSVLVRTKTAPAELSALLNSFPSTSSTTPLTNYNGSTIQKAMGNGIPDVKKELTPKDVSRLWSNEDLKLNNITQTVKVKIGRMRSRHYTAWSHLTTNHKSLDKTTVWKLPVCFAHVLCNLTVISIDGCIRNIRWLLHDKDTLRGKLVPRTRHHL